MLVRRHLLTACLWIVQFDKVLSAYKARSKLWNPTLNKFAEGKVLCLFVLTALTSTKFLVTFLTII